jgi:hypothetical protein
VLYGFWVIVIGIGVKLFDFIYERVTRIGSGAISVSLFLSIWLTLSNVSAVAIVSVFFVGIFC